MVSKIKHFYKKNFTEDFVPSKLTLFFFVDPKTSEWSFHIKDHDQLMISIKSLESDIQIEKLPYYILKVIDICSQKILFEILREINTVIIYFVDVQNKRGNRFVRY